jgi:hypothetical protein
MKHATDEEIAAQLVAIISDGFNRSLGALVEAGALDTTKLQRHYTGVGSKFYDLVTEQIEVTAKHATPGMRRLFSDDNKPNTNS